MTHDAPLVGRNELDQGRWAPLRQLEISFSQGAEWKALISRYIGTIPLSCSPFQAAGTIILRSFFKLFSVAAAGHGRRHDHQNDD